MTNLFPTLEPPKKRLRDSGTIRPTLNQAKNHKTRLGEFEFQYFGGSDVANKLSMWFTRSTNLLICSQPESP